MTSNSMHPQHQSNSVQMIVLSTSPPLFPRYHRYAEYSRTVRQQVWNHGSPCGAVWWCTNTITCLLQKVSPICESCPRLESFFTVRPHRHCQSSVLQFLLSDLCSRAAVVCYCSDVTSPQYLINLIISFRPVQRSTSLPPTSQRAIPQTFRLTSFSNLSSHAEQTLERRMQLCAR